MTPLPRSLLRAKPHQLKVVRGKVTVRPRFKTTKHRGFASGAFGGTAAHNRVVVPETVS